MRMVDRGGDPGLLFEFRALFRIRAAFLLEDLEGNIPTESAVDRFVDRPHPPFAEQFHKPVVVELPVGAQPPVAIRAENLRQWSLICHIHQRLADGTCLDQASRGADLRGGFFGDR